ncbi:grasp-with-spasm system ATP-grasp peptide maturase [Chryseobacterium sp. SIMBA_029]|uniref:grasp-with-spasm system ATP-grasp peptide maturase n=1 Tax=Chryseobacterium sp. SIMBA_029 TaxID=3085772 RepID=UPI003978C3F6
MILFLTNYWDYSTQKLIDIFKDKGFEDYMVITTSDIFEHKMLIEVNGDVVIGNQKIDFEKITAVWCRRFASLDYTDHYDNAIKDNFEFFGFDSIKFKEQLRAEFLTLISYINYRLKDKIWYPAASGNLNKLIVLQEAAQAGLQIPKTFITNRSITDSAKEGMITKSIHDANFMNSKNGYMMSMLTKEIDFDHPDIPSEFFPSLVQNKIDKEYELRIFFIDEEFYPMAIFSQGQDETKLDFRIKTDTPTRYVRYNLPEDIRTRLTILFKKLSLRTGSIDMIKNKKGEYIFLEINPVGQYGMTSNPCNYNLDYKIADHLIKLCNHENIKIS